jgi:hypothetical protein
VITLLVLLLLFSFGFHLRLTNASKTGTTLLNVWRFTTEAALLPSTTKGFSDEARKGRGKASEALTKRP